MAACDLLCDFKELSRCSILAEITVHRSPCAVQISYEAWLICRNEDASKKIFVATGSLVFDYELFIDGHYDLLDNKEALLTKSDKH